MSTSIAEPMPAGGGDEMMEPASASCCGLFVNQEATDGAAALAASAASAASAVSDTPHAPNLEGVAGVGVSELEDSDSDDDSDGEYDTDEENEAAYEERYGTEACKGIVAPKIEGGRPFNKLPESMQKRVWKSRTNFRWSRGAPPPGTSMYRGPPPSGIEPPALVRKKDRHAILLSSDPGPLYPLRELLKSPSFQAAVPKMLRDRAELGGLFRGRINVTEEQATGGFAACSTLFTKISAPPAVRVSSGKLCFDVGCETMLGQLKSGFGGDVARYLDVVSDHCEISMVLLVLGTDNEERWHMDRLIGMWTKGSIGRMFLTIGTTADGKQFGFGLKDPEGIGRCMCHENEIMFDCPNGTFFLMDAITSGALWHDHLFGLMHAGRNGGGAGGIALDLTAFKPGKSMESMLAALGGAGFLDGSKGADITPGSISIPKIEDMHPRAKAYGKAAETVKTPKCHVQVNDEERMTKRARATNVLNGDRRGTGVRVNPVEVEDYRAAKLRRDRINSKARYGNNSAAILEGRRDKRIDKKIRNALEEAQMNEESISLVWDDIVEMVKQKPRMSARDIVSNASVLLAQAHLRRCPPVAHPASTSALGATATIAGNQHMMAAMTAQMTQMMAMTGMPAFTNGMPVPSTMTAGMPFTGMAGVPAMMAMPPGGIGIFPGAATSSTNAEVMDWSNMMAMASAHANAAAMFAAGATSALSSASATSAGPSGVAPKHLPAAPAPAPTMTMGVRGNANDIKVDATTATPAKGNTKDTSSNAESTASASTSGNPTKAKTAEVEMMDVAKEGQTNASLVPISAAKSPPGTQFMVPSAPSPTSIADLPISGDGSPNNSAKGDKVSNGVGIDILIGSDENDDNVDGGKIPEYEDDQSTVDVDLGDDDEESAKAAPKVRPEFDLPHVQTIGDGIFDGKIAQIDVNGVGKDCIEAKLTFFPPGSSPRKYMYQHPGAMQALANGKSTLRDHFEVDKKEIGGTEKIDALDLEVSSDLYHTLVLCKPDRKCTCLSFVMFKRIEGSEDWWVPWLATNKDKQYMKRGYSRFLLETVKQLASGFGANNIYLEVGIPSMMPDYTGDENDDDENTEASKWARAGTFYSRLEFVSAGDDVPDEVLSLCKEVRKGTHEVLRWDLTTT